jgi:hypothetical protein
MKINDASSVLFQYSAPERFVRWSDLDQSNASLCWLDRKDGHLLYLEQGVDPNLSGSNANDSRISNVIAR